MDMVKKESTPKASKESGGRKEPPNRRGGKRDGNQEERPSVWGLQEWLAEIKLFSIMKKTDPRSADYLALQDLSTKISSGKKEERATAREAVDKISGQVDKASHKSQEWSLEAVLHEALPDYEGRTSLQETVKAVTQSNDVILESLKSKKEIPTEQLVGFEEQLKRLSNELGFKENREGFRKMHETLTRAIELNDVRRNIHEPRAYEAPIKKKAEQFEKGDISKGEEDKGQRLQMRHWKWGQKGKTREAIEDFKTKVREELIDDDGKKSRELSGKDLMDRLTMVRERTADLRSLVGNKNEILHDTMDTLASVELQYQALLEERLAIDLKFPEGTDQEALVGEVLEDIIRDAKGGKWGRGRARIDFDMTYDEMKETVGRAVKRREMSGAKISLIESMSKEVNGNENPEEIKEAMERFHKGGLTVKESGDLLNTVLGKIGEKYDSTMLGKLRNKEHGIEYGEGLIKELHDVGGSGSEKAALQNFIDKVRLDRTGIEIEQRRFEELVAKGQYGKAYRRLKAYITDVGLRETSSDFQFAIMLRNAKYMIGRVNEDIGEEFDQWQQSYFVPNLKDINPENANEILPKVWSQSNIDHVFGTDFANAGAMLVELPDGTRKTWSAAVMYQELQSTRASMHILNADVNHVDGSMYRVFLEHMFGEGAHIDGSDVVGLDGKKIIGMADRLNVTDFELDTAGLAAGKPQEDTLEALTVAEIIKQSTWMNRRGATFWMYSGEVSEHLAHYPKEQMQNANKWAASVDRMGHGYSMHFGKITAPYAEIAKVNHLLPELRVFKDTGILQLTIRDSIIDAKLKKLKNGETISDEEMKKTQEFAKVFTKKLEKRIKVEGKDFTVGMRSREEIRLIGNEFKDKGQAWEEAGRKWLEAHGIKPELIPSAGDLLVYENEINNRSEEDFIRGKSKESLKEAKKKFAWIEQQKEFWALCEELKWDNEDANIDIGEADKVTELTLMTRKIKADDLDPLVKRQNMIVGGNWNPQSTGEFIEGLEFAAVMNPARFLQGTDPVEYATKYRKAAMEVAGKLPTLFSGRATAKEIIEVNKLLRSYMPPDVVNAWWEAFTRIDIKANTNNLRRYEVPKVNLESGQLISRNVTDEKGNTYWLVGRDGHRIAEKEVYNEIKHGSYSKFMWGRKTLRGRDVEIRYAALSSEGMLPRPIMDNILDDVVGGGQNLDRMLGLEGKSASEKAGTRAMLVKKVLARTYRLIKRFPLFDDPGWALWSLSTEIVNFVGEASKEITKDALK